MKRKQRMNRMEKQTDRQNEKNRLTEWKIDRKNGKRDRQTEWKNKQTEWKNRQTDRMGKQTERRRGMFEENVTSGNLFIGAC
jgi:hypothetical protein